MHAHTSRTSSLNFSHVRTSCAHSRTCRTNALLACTSRMHFSHTLLACTCCTHFLHTSRTHLLHTPLHTRTHFSHTRARLFRTHARTFRMPACTKFSQALTAPLTDRQPARQTDTQIERVGEGGREVVREGGSAGPETPLFGPQF